MSESVNISVAVITYNQKFEDIASTLYSILAQSYTDYEIVVSDDGSRENHASKIENLFKNEGFTNYRLNLNKENQGIVKNMISAIDISQGKIIKVISPGDIFFDQDVLNKIARFHTEKHFRMAFGKVRAFNNNTLQHTPFKAPGTPELYHEKPDFDLQLKSQILHTDWIPGCALFYERSFILDYLRRLSDKYGVIYSEDLTCPLVTLDKEEILYLDEYILWYEWGDGISSSGSTETRKRMYRDHASFYKELRETYDDNQIVRASARYFKIREFLMLKTPIAQIAKRYKETNYMKSSELSDSDMALNTDFLKQCIEKASRFR